MGVYTSSFQMKTEYYEEILELLNSRVSIYNKDKLYSEAVRKIDDKIWEIIENTSLSSIANKSIIDDNLIKLLTKDKESPYDYDINRPEFLPFIGSSHFEFSLLDEGGYGILRLVEVEKISDFIIDLKVTTKEGFDKYYSDLPEDLKDDLYMELFEEETEEDALFEYLEPFVNFYLDSQKNKSWVLLYIN